MGIFGKKKSSYVLDIDSINKNIDNNLSKSFRSGKAVSVSSIDGMQYGNVNKDTKEVKLDTQKILNQKKMLNAAASNILVQSIIRTRTNQILKFCKPAYLTDNNLGFKIIPKDPNKNVSKKDLSTIRELENFIYYTGYKKDYKEYRDTFPEFVTKLVYDMYVHDQINIERCFESATSSKLNHFNIVDASTIVIDKVNKHSDKPRTFSQWVDNQKVATFNEKELTFINFWKKSEIDFKGYGQSPLLVALQHLKYYDNTTEYNGRFFEQGGTTKGLLFLNTDGAQLSSQQLDSIRRSWQPLNGLNGAWKIPMVTGIKDAKFVNMQQSSGDYEFSGWLSYLINMVSSVFQVDPSEINFPNKSGGSMSRSGGSTLNEGNSLKTKVDMSRDKGLKPVLDFIERIVNDYLLPYVKNSDGYHFVFTLGNEDEKNKADLIAVQLKNGLTINEAREQMGYKPLTGELEDLVNQIPGDASALMQYLAISGKFDPESNESMQNEKSTQRPYKKLPNGDKNEPDTKLDESEKLSNKD